MKSALPETVYVFDMLLSNDQRSQIQAFLDEVKIKKEKYSPQILWKIDQKIGGIGGYCYAPRP